MSDNVVIEAALVLSCFVLTGASLFIYETLKTPIIIGCAAVFVGSVAAVVISGISYWFIPLVFVVYSLVGRTLSTIVWSRKLENNKMVLSAHLTWATVFYGYKSTARTKNCSTAVNSISRKVLDGQVDQLWFRLVERLVPTPTESSQLIIAWACLWPLMLIWASLQMFSSMCMALASGCVVDPEQQFLDTMDDLK